MLISEGSALVSERAASVSKRGGNSAIGAPAIGEKEASGRKQGRCLHSGGDFVCEGGVRQGWQGPEGCKIDQCTDKSVAVLNPRRAGGGGASGRHN